MKDDFCAFTFLCHRREGLESTWGMSNRKNLIVERTCFRLQVDVLYSQSPNDNVVSASATYNRLLFLPQSQTVSLPEDMNKHSAFSSWWRNRPLLSSSCYMTHYWMSMLKQFILEPYWVVILESLLQLRDSNSQGCSAWKMQRDQYVSFLCFKCRFDYSFHTSTQSTETPSGCLSDFKNILLIHHNTNSSSFLLESKLSY